MEAAKIKVRVQLNIHGIVTLISASVSVIDLSTGTLKHIGPETFLRVISLFY